jgi:hypothetical protein
MIDISRVRALIKDKTLDPSLLELKLNSAIATFKNLTNREWSLVTGKEERWLLDVTKRPVDTTIWTKYFPISTIVLEEWDFNEAESAAEEIDEEYLNIDNERGRIIRNDGFYLPFVKATVSGGLTNDQIWSDFPDIVEAIILQVNFSIKRDNEENIAINSQGFEGGQTNLRTSEYLPKFLKVVSRHKRLV